MSEDELPEGWTESAMGDVAEVVGGGTPKASDPANFAKRGHPWITPADLSSFRSVYIQRGSRDLSDVGLRTSSAKMVPAGTVLMSSRAPIGYLAVAANPVSTNQGFRSFICMAGIHPEFVYYWLMYSRDLIEEMGSGSTFTEISGSRCKEIPFRFPPLAEQKRIVAKVEELFTGVNAARERLARVPAILKRFRQAVLAAACEGRLTEGWRAAVSATRDQDREEGSPAGWRPVTLATVCQSIADGDHQPPPKADTGVPFIVISNLTSGNVDFGNTRFVPQAYFDRIQPQRRPRPGDILVSLVGTIGVTVQVRDPRPFCFQRHIGLLRPNRSVLPEFLSCMVQSRGFLDQAIESATGSAQLTVPLKALRGIGFLLPPIAEQREIVRRVEALFKLADAIEKRVAAATARAEKLTQAILAKAFRGELVPTEAELARREGRSYERG